MPPVVAAIRRYPVKAMGGESLTSVELDARGLAGDRWFAVADGDGHFASGKNTRRFRRRGGVFGYAARTEAPGEVVVTGPSGAWKVGDPALDHDLTATLGLPVAVRPEEHVAHQDAGAVSLVSTATLRWCAERWGIDADPRRLRVNVGVDADEPFVEESWLGRELRVGGAVLGVTARAERCRTIDVEQDGVKPATRWLKRLGQERDLRLAVYADVREPGPVCVGDRVSLP